MLRKQFLETSRGRIAELLQRGTQTVDALAAALRLTPNAVRAQLTIMERDGLVKRAGLLPGATRPSHRYELTPALEELLSGAYVPLLIHLVRTVSAALRPAQLDPLLRQTGRSLALEVTGGSRLPGDLATRVRKASEFLNDELGAVTKVARRNGGFVLQGQGCPLAAITGKEPAVCTIVESLLQELVGAPVHQCCDRTGRPTCCFDIHPGPRLA
jgi:predicted ArsR family transcriptional regulator